MLQYVDFNKTNLSFVFIFTLPQKWDSNKKKQNFSKQIQNKAFGYITAIQIEGKCCCCFFFSFEWNMSQTCKSSSLSLSNVTKDVSFQQLNKSMWINLLRNKLDPNQKNYIHKFESDNSVIQQNKSNFKSLKTSNQKLHIHFDSLWARKV